MEHSKYLGLYFRENSVTGVCLDAEKKSRPVVDIFTARVETDSEDKLREMAELIKRNCEEKEFAPEEVTVAIDNVFFMQHDVHTPFTETKRINQTIRFDTEEALASDVNDMALAYKINTSDESGSDLTVFTVKKDFMSELIKSLQSQGFDPSSIEPDIVCLSRSFKSNFEKLEEENYLFAAFSNDRGFFIAHDNENYDLILRTFLIPAQDDRTSILRREFPLTLALHDEDEKINSIKVIDETGQVNVEELQVAFGVKVSFVEAGDMIDNDLGRNGAVSTLIANGAARRYSEDRKSLNFRNDFMPYMGRRLQIERSLKILGVALTILFISLGGYLTADWFKKYQPYRKLHNKFSQEYSSVMLGKSFPDRLSPVTKLKSEYRRIKNIKSGQLSATGEKSVGAKFTLLMDAFNKVAKSTDLNIHSVSITSKVISISGDTNNRRSSIKFFDVLEAVNFNIVKKDLETEGGRDNFRIDVKTSRR